VSLQLLNSELIRFLGENVPHVHSQLSFLISTFSGVMMLINLFNAIVRLDLGLSNCSTEKLLSQSKLLIGLSALTFCYLGLLRSAGVTFSSEGFTWCGLTMLFLATAMETHVLDICLLTSRQGKERQRILQLMTEQEDEETSHRGEEDLLTEYVLCGAKGS
jgi:hypothetical protein